MGWTLEGSTYDITASRDREGHREYKVQHLLRAASVNDTPASAWFASGLPRPGDQYHFGNDVDAWAFCLPEGTLRRHDTKPGEPFQYLLAEQTFSTKPPEGKFSRCNDNPIEDPLLEPAKIDGGSAKYQEEAAEDRFGFPILSSSHEQIRGPQVEFDKNRATLKIEQNVVSFASIAAAYELLDTVNAVVIWGFAYRCVKLSAVTWQRKFYGRCYKYFTRILEFDTNRDTFDRTLLDEGTKVLHGKWGTSGAWILLDIDGASPDPDNPQHFDRFQDRNGNVCRVILNGAGLPAGVQIGTGSGQEIPPAAGPYLMSITTSHEAGDTSDETKWVRLVGAPGNEAFWDNSSGGYPRGSLVVWAASGTATQTYVQTNSDGSSEEPGTGSDWIVVVPNDRGQYDGSASYAVGDYVNLGRPGGTFGVNVSPVGSIFVQKYDEGDFLTLGVPLEF